MDIFRCCGSNRLPGSIPKKAAKTAVYTLHPAIVSLTNTFTADGKGRGTGVLISSSLILTTHGSIPTKDSALDCEIVICYNSPTSSSLPGPHPKVILTKRLVPSKFFLTDYELDITFVACENVGVDVAPLFLSAFHLSNNFNSIDVGRKCYLLGHTKLPANYSYVCFGQSKITVEETPFICFPSDCSKGYSCWTDGSAGFDQNGRFSFLVCNPPSLISSRKHNQQAGLLVNTILSFLESNNGTQIMHFRTGKITEKSFSNSFKITIPTADVSEIQSRPSIRSASSSTSSEFEFKKDVYIYDKERNRPVSVSLRVNGNTDATSPSISGTTSDGPFQLESNATPATPQNSPAVESMVSVFNEESQTKIQEACMSINPSLNGQTTSSPPRNDIPFHPSQLSISADVAHSLPSSVHTPADGKPVENSNAEKPVEQSNAEKSVLKTIEKPVENPNAEKLDEISNTEKPVEKLVKNSKVEKSLKLSVENPSENLVLKNNIENTSVEKPVDNEIAEKPVEISNAEKPVQTAITEEPVEIPNAEKLVDDSNTEKPAENPNAEPVERLSPEIVSQRIQGYGNLSRKNLKNLKKFPNSEIWPSDSLRQIVTAPISLVVDLSQDIRFVVTNSAKSVGLVRRVDTDEHGIPIQQIRARELKLKNEEENKRRQSVYNEGASMFKPKRMKSTEDSEEENEKEREAGEEAGAGAGAGTGAGAGAGAGTGTGAGAGAGAGAGTGTGEEAGAGVGVGGKLIHSETRVVNKKKIELLNFSESMKQSNDGECMVELNDENERNVNDVKGNDVLMAVDSEKRMDDEFSNAVIVMKDGKEKENVIELNDDVTVKKDARGKGEVVIEEKDGRWTDNVIEKKDVNRKKDIIEKDDVVVKNDVMIKDEVMRKDDVILKDDDANMHSLSKLNASIMMNNEVVEKETEKWALQRKKMEGERKKDLFIDVKFIENEKEKEEKEKKKEKEISSSLSSLSFGSVNSNGKDNKLSKKEVESKSMTKNVKHKVNFSAMEKNTSTDSNKDDLKLKSENRVKNALDGLIGATGRLGNLAQKQGPNQTESFSTNSSPHGITRLWPKSPKSPAGFDIVFVLVRSWTGLPDVTFKFIRTAGDMTLQQEAEWLWYEANRMTSDVTSYAPMEAPDMDEQISMNVVIGH